MQHYIELYKEMIPNMSIDELYRQKESFEQDKGLPGFENSTNSKILEIINNYIYEKCLHR